MPITNGNLSFNTGRDIRVVVVGPSGTIQLDNLMSFDSKQQVNKVNLNRIDGQQGNAALSKGWTGTIKSERANNGLDQAFADMESAWIDGGSYQVSTIYVYINNADGSSTTYQFDNCALTLSNAGEWKSDSTVPMTIEFEAARRRSV